VGLAISGLLIENRRYTQALLVVAFGFLALRSIRHIPIYSIVAIPVMVGELSERWNRWVGDQPRKSTAAILQEMSSAGRERMLPISIWSIVGLVAMLVLPAASSWPRDFPANRFPVEIAARQAGRLAESRLFTTDQWADYLMFKNPAQRVFLDDRSLYDPQIVSDALTLADVGVGWKQLMEKYRIDAVLMPADTALANALAEDRRWTVVDQDDKIQLFQIVAR
jgi:hypothetical protein